jgi:2-C-methyl-D-erythritol 4-phosphate cytidylyltransferase
VSPELILRVARAAREHGAAVPCVPLADTVKEVSRGRVKCTLDRSRLVAAQTPQGFRRELLEKAFRRAGAGGLAATDDASLVERIVPGGVCVVEGEGANVKVTTPEDLAWCELVLSRGARPRRRR